MQHAELETTDLALATALLAGRGLEPSGYVPLAGTNRVAFRFSRSAELVSAVCDWARGELSTGTPVQWRQAQQFLRARAEIAVLEESKNRKG